MGRFITSGHVPHRDDRMNYISRLPVTLPACWFAALAWFACGMPSGAAEVQVVILGGTIFDSESGKLLPERTSFTQ